MWMVNPAGHFVESKLILEEIKKEQQFESNVKDSEVEKTLESVQTDKELQKLEHFIQGSPTGGAVGSHRRLVLTQTAADLCLIMFCIFDLPLTYSSYWMKKGKYSMWLLQCIIVIM